MTVLIDFNAADDGLAGQSERRFGLTRGSRQTEIWTTLLIDLANGTAGSLLAQVPSRELTVERCAERPASPCVSSDFMRT